MKTIKQLIIIVVAGFLVPITVLSLLVNYINQLRHTSAGTHAISKQGVTKGIAASARVEIHAAAPVTAALNTPPSDAQAAGATTTAAIASISPNTAANQTDSSNLDALKIGKNLYTQVCQTCHAAGLLGAPRFGNQADWAPRLKKPINEIYRYALHGKGNMPPQSGSNASDADVEAAVDYMIKAVK